MLAILAFCMRTIGGYVYLTENLEHHVLPCPGLVLRCPNLVMVRLNRGGARTPRVEFLRRAICCIARGPKINLKTYLQVNG